MSYRVGDKVRIRTDLIVNETYQGYDFVDEMEKYKGQESTILKEYDDGEYTLFIDRGEYFWTNAMLEPVVKGETNFEHYRYEIIKFIRSSGFTCDVYSLMFGENASCDSNCDKCVEKMLEWFNAEYNPIKLTQTERDILQAFKVYSDYKFENYPPLTALKEKGYFQNINVEMTIEELLKCGVHEDE